MNKLQEVAHFRTNRCHDREWPELFGDYAIATAILDRVLHHSHAFSIKGNSYRLRERRLAISSPAQTDSDSQNLSERR